MNTGGESSQAPAGKTVKRTEKREGDGAAAAHALTLERAHGRAGPTGPMEQLIGIALARRRQRLTHLTRYDHGDVEAAVRDWTGAEWTVHAPRGAASCAGPALSAAWPADGGHADAVVARLRERGFGDPRDRVDGACEDLARFLGEHALGSTTDADPCARAHASALGELDGLAVHEQVDRVFAQEAKGPRTWPGVNENKNLLDYTLGGGDVESNAREFLDSLGESGKGMMPLYIVNYIFDGDELNDAELGVNVDETAQYSVHCVAVAFDRGTRVAIIADPNGALVPGASMEFLAVPPRARAGGATTALSQSDIDARAEKKQATKKKRKRARRG